MKSVNLSLQGNPRTMYSPLASALKLALSSAMFLPFSAAAQTVIAEGQVVEIPGTYPSPWNVPASTDPRGDLHINGTLAIRNGGVVNNAKATVWTDTSSAPAATVMVDGAGSVWNSGELMFGEKTGRSQLDIINGGVVNSGLTRITSGTFSNSQAQVSVRGMGSAFNTDTLQVGNFFSEAKVNIVDGGLLHSRGPATVGFFFNDKTGSYMSNSQVAVSGEGSRWNADAGVKVVEGSQVVVANAGVLTASNIALESGLRSSDAYGELRGGGVLTIGGQLQFERNLAPHAWRPSAPSAPGQIVADNINFGFGNLVFNHTSSDYGFGAKLVTLYPDSTTRGEMNVLVYAGTTRLTADSSAFKGDTGVFGGKLLIDGALGGNATVHDGGSLGGNGRFQGNVVVNSGGKLAPGNSIGKFSVGGDLTFQPGSIYEVEVTPQGTSDQVAVAGKAVINGGSVVSVGQDSGFQPFTRYTILTASGGVSGQFAVASNNYAFLKASLAYEPNAVKLQLLRNDVSFGALGATANQRAAAAGAESTGAGHAVWNALAVLNPEQARAAFDSISGELHASTQTALIEEALSIQNVVLDGYDDREQRGDTRLWIKALGGRAQTDADGDTAKLERNSSGLLIGADTALGEDWRVGAMVGAGKTRNDVDARASRSESDNLHFGVYADAAWESGWHLRLGGIRSTYDTDSRRRVTLAGLGNQFTMSTDARATQFYGELGYAFDAGAVELEPFLGASQIKLDTDGFGEAGGDGALQSEDVDTTTRYATLGVRLGYDFGETSRWRLGGSLGWRRASGDLEPVSKLRFAGGQQFLVEGAPIARNTTVVTAGVSGQLSALISLDVSYLRQFASETDDHGASAKLTFRF